MKRISTAILLITAILIASCKKNDSAGATGQWAFAGNTYKASGTSYSKADSALTASSDGGSLTVYFPSATVESGSYLIANYDSVPLSSGHVYLRFIDAATSQYYFSTGEDHTSATVSVSSGRISVSIPSASLMSYSNPVPYTGQLTASISQQ